MTVTWRGTIGYAAQLSVPGKFLVHFEFSEEEKKWSSTYRELRVLHALYTSDKVKQFSGQRLLHSCDNLNVSKIVQYGSRNKDIQKLVVEMYEACTANSIDMVAEWRPRTDSVMVLMDMGSCCPVLNPVNEFQLSFNTIIDLVNKFEVSFDVDLCASFLNKKAPRFFSAVLDPRAEGLNMFEQTLNSRDFYYGLPPPSLALSVFKPMLWYGAQGVVTVSLWWRQVWPARMFPQGHAAAFIQQLWIWRPVFVKDAEARSGSSRARRPSTASLCGWGL
jgi:hypothetical protein